MVKRVKVKHKPIMIDKKSLAVIGVTDDEDSESKRYECSAVKLEPDGTTVGLDGRKILAVEPPRDDPKDFPNAGRRADWKAPAIPKDGVLLTKRIAVNLLGRLKKLRKAAVYKPILGNALLTRCDDMMEFATTDLSSTQKEAASPGDGAYPEWKQHFVDGYDRVFARVNMSIGHLQDLLDAAANAAGDGECDSVVELSLTCDTAPNLVLRGRAGSNRRFAGILAPVRVRNNASDESTWERDVLGVEERDADRAETLKMLAAITKHVICGGDLSADDENAVRRLSHKMGVRVE